MLAINIIITIGLFLFGRNSIGDCCKATEANYLQLLRDYVLWRDAGALVVLSENSRTAACTIRALRGVAPELLYSGYGAAVPLRVPSRGATVMLCDSADAKCGLTGSVPRLPWAEAKVRRLLVLNGEGGVDKLRTATLGLDADLVIAARTRTENSEPKHPYVDDVSLSTVCQHFDQCNDTNHCYCLVQAYQIRIELNTSLVLHPLGFWDPVKKTSSLTPVLPPEKRTNFQGFPLIVGKKEATAAAETENSIEDDSDEEQLTEISRYFKLFLNATDEVIYYQKLGHREPDGQWTDLLRSVVDEEVDLGLDRIITTPERYEDMAFTHPILKSMRNIYIRPQKSNEIRDIFLAPFGTRLLLCVISTGVIFSIAKALASRSTTDYGDAVIWCIGIFSMQGSAWSPRSCSGNIVLITTLAFALLLFNSYSAFITSVLSVDVAKIRSVDDLLASNYNIGYAKNSQDEFYLRSMNDTQLQQIYLRGYLHNAVGNITEGLLKSIKGQYGFFASGNMARKELQHINAHRCIYDIMEIPISATKNTIAFPIAWGSPYRSIINLGIVKMYETGVYKYIHSQIVPDLPICEKTRIFRCADLPDLMSGFAILMIGMIGSIIILCAECLWQMKKQLFNTIQQKMHLK